MAPQTTLIPPPAPAVPTASRGRPTPLGTTPTPDGANFVVLSRHARSVTLLLFPEGGGSKPFAEFPLDPKRHRTGDHWHVRVHNLPNTFCYGWRVNGPPGVKNRFDPTRILLDPASTMLSDGATWAGTCETDKERTSRRSLYHRTEAFDWGDDVSPLTPLEDSVIYELHVRGFTIHPSGKVKFPGTYAGLVEKIPYLQWLGVTAVELLPVHEFDECDCPFADPTTGEKHVNFWGYNSVAFAAPKAAFAASAAGHGQIREFREMVKAFHAAGIEVYLDVVFNHTGEGDDRGRAYSFRGLDNEMYYLLNERGQYLNFSGVGNTVNCNHPVVRELILTCLRYWAGHMRVDGFRFDLASILGRDRFGNVMVEPPVIEQITEDGVLADTKLIAEPWDAAGLYQVGKFPFGRRWSEWNGRYRDDVRRFWRGEPGFASAMATRLAGSSDLYQWSGRLPRHSINFITCHDGFTLNDQVSYNDKHNAANGERNRDGCNENYSWNCGVEGPTDDPIVNALRQRQAKNHFATLFLSQGVPMLLAGDEFLRTQRGNNNAWCQDNALSWVDWTLAETNKDFLRFAREMIQFRHRHPALRRRRFLQGEMTAKIDPPDVDPFPPSGPVRPADVGEEADPPPPPPPAKLPTPARDIAWHGLKPHMPDFAAASRQLAYVLDGRHTGGDPDADIYVAINAGAEAVKFVVPPAPNGGRWRRVVDTAKPSPQDFIPEGEGPVVPAGAKYAAAAFSLVVLTAGPP